jgi:DNA-binding helix-hairpin-helix protein with protein kinase domain
VDKGRAVSLSKLLGRGGEGTVYEVANDPNIAAKIYMPTRRTRGETKSWQWCRQVSTPARAESPIQSTPFSIQVVHLLGSRCKRSANAGRYTNSIHLAADAKFSKADFRFLVRSALNVANAVAAVHSAGCVIGDINHSGILISQDAIAALMTPIHFNSTFEGTPFAVLSVCPILRRRNSKVDV